MGRIEQFHRTKRLPVCVTHEISVTLTYDLLRAVIWSKREAATGGKNCSPFSPGKNYILSCHLTAELDRKYRILCDVHDREHVAAPK